jgi:hypothetical protein
MRSGLEERRERGSFGLSTAVPPPRSELTEVFRRSGTILPIPAGLLAGFRQFSPAPSPGAHKSRYPQTKQQKPPRRIKFLQERFDHSWDVHAVGQAVALMCATRADARSGLRAILPVGPVPGSRDQHWGLVWRWR